MQAFQPQISLLNSLSIKSHPSPPETSSWLKASPALFSPDSLSVTNPAQALCQCSVRRADAAEGTVSIAAQPHFSLGTEEPPAHNVRICLRSTLAISHHRCHSFRGWQQIREQRRLLFQWLSGILSISFKRYQLPVCFNKPSPQRG